MHTSTGKTYKLHADDVWWQLNSGSQGKFTNHLSTSLEPNSRPNFFRKVGKGFIAIDLPNLEDFQEKKIQIGIQTKTHFSSVEGLERLTMSVSSSPTDNCNPH